uniref:Uncharacterized protein n=1 Tax=Cyanistes caeruleus TaxID=156563 RepID=A0A8C0UD08_CYACU
MGQENKKTRKSVSTEGRNLKNLPCIFLPGLSLGKMSLALPDIPFPALSNDFVDQCNEAGFILSFNSSCKATILLLLSSSCFSLF